MAVQRPKRSFGTVALWSSGALNWAGKPHAPAGREHCTSLRRLENAAMVTTVHSIGALRLTSWLDGCVL
jgi:hypothetical protein